jgi:hypothetical protein
VQKYFSTIMLFGEKNVFLLIILRIEMKKWICIYIFLSGFSFFGKAEITFGARAGFSYTSLTQKLNEEVSYGGRVGFAVAGLMDMPLSQRFSLRPELAFISQGGAYSLEYIKDVPYWERYKRNYYSVMIPINLSYQIMSGAAHVNHVEGLTINVLRNDWQVGVYGGPSVTLSSQVKETENFEVRRFRPFDIGMGVGFYVEYQKFFFTIYSHTGLLDRLEVRHPNESHLYQNNVMFSFGYWLRR